MNTIYKYELTVATTQSIMLPKHSVILSVQEQGNELCMWARVDTDNVVEPTTIKIYDTGDVIDFDGYTHNHIATVQTGNMVWHIFEVIE